MDKVDERLKAGSAEAGPMDLSIAPEAEEIRKDVEAIRVSSRRLKVLSSDYLASNSKKARSLYDKKCTEIASLTTDAKKRIEEMDAKTQQFERQHKMANAELRLRRRYALKFTETLMFVTREAQRVKFEFEKALESQTVTRVKVRHTDDTGKVHIDEAGAQKMARQLVKSRRERHMFMQAQAELEDALSQREDLMELQRAVQDLAAMIQDLHMLATAQQRNLEDSAGNAEKALDEAQIGNENLRSARKAQKMCAIQ